MNLFLIISFLYLTFSTQNDKLIFVMTHFRHGARAPNIEGFAKIDKIGEYWEHGGVLTGVGKRMHFLLGFRNRLRYIKEYKLLSEKYNSTEIKIICNGVERAQLSLSSHLQGLYPPNENLGENLNELQLKRSDPPVNISNSTIEQKKINLNNDSLPNSMVVILFESLNIISLSSCHGGGRGGGGGGGDPPPLPPPSPTPSHNPRGYDIENEFNEKYKEKFNQFEGLGSTKNYTFHEISDICDTYIADYVDGREMSNFSKFFDLDEFYEYCLRQFEIEQIQSRISTEERQYASGTYFMGLLINYTKLKIDEDLGINNSTNIKMLIVSGHDSTVNTQQFFMQFALGTSSNFSRNPTFASQMAFEIKRNDNDKKIEIIRIILLIIILMMSLY